jgi:hypothetical protein
MPRCEACLEAYMTANPAGGPPTPRPKTPHCERYDERMERMIEANSGCFDDDA